VESEGGRIHEALNMARLIRARGMSTYTEEGCESAATLVFMAGKERTAADGAKIGFHRGTLHGTTTEQESRMNTSLASAMRRAGITESFTKQVIAVPNDEMWYPTTEELVRARVLTSK
jgi:hypothetical protein